jgi:hypothetical protein
MKPQTEPRLYFTRSHDEAEARRRYRVRMGKRPDFVKPDDEHPQYLVAGMEVKVSDLVPKNTVLLVQPGKEPFYIVGLEEKGEKET